MVIRILYLFYMLTGLISVSRSATPRINRGEDAQPGEFPWLISIQRYDIKTEEWVHACGGAIIDNRHVISAAHCGPPTNFKWVNKTIVAGAHNIKDTTEPTRKLYKPCRFHIHPDYNENYLTNDMMVMTLTEPIVFDERIQPIRLAPPDSDPVGKVCVVAGWGWIENVPETTILQKINTRVISLEECLPYGEEGPFTVNEFNVCTKPDIHGKAINHGDSGGPLICYDDKGPYAHGLCSWGMEPEGTGDVYAGVKAHLNFIKCRTHKV